MQTAANCFYGIFKIPWIWYHKYYKYYEYGILEIPYLWYFWNIYILYKNSGKGKKTSEIILCSVLIFSETVEKTVSEKLKLFSLPSEVILTLLMESPKCQLYFNTKIIEIELLIADKN